MIGRKFIVIIAAVAAVGLGAVLGLFLTGQGFFAPPSVEQGKVAGAGDASPVEEPEAAAVPAVEPVKPQADAAGALKPPAEPTSVPTFDVVVIEANGEGVIAGRAAPGWKVSVQSGGTKVAEAKADLQGEWSVVLEKPLEAGDHALSLKITSPDGTRALSSQDSVRVEVGADAKKASAPTSVEATAKAPEPKPTEPKPETTASAPAEIAPAPEAAAPASAKPEAAPAEKAGGEADAQQVARAEQAPADTGPRAVARTEGSAAPAPRPTLVFKTVDYEDLGPATGTVTLSGTADPGTKVTVYYDNQPLAEVRADRDGQWRVEAKKKLGMGQHSFRAERVDAATGLSGRAVVTIERVEPKPEPPKAPVVAAKPGTPSSPASQVAAAQQALTDGKTYVIRRGDTLWAIAKRYLGGGSRYTSIFQDNRKVIHNPNLIHPQQEVTLPKP